MARSALSRSTSAVLGGLSMLVLGAAGCQYNWDLPESGAGGATGGGGAPSCPGVANTTGTAACETAPWRCAPTPALACALCRCEVEACLSSKECAPQLICGLNSQCAWGDATCTAAVCSANGSPDANAAAAVYQCLSQISDPCLTSCTDDFETQAGCKLATSGHCLASPAGSVLGECTALPTSCKTGGAQGLLLKQGFDLQLSIPASSATLTLVTEVETDAKLSFYASSGQEVGAVVPTKCGAGNEVTPQTVAFKPPAVKAMLVLGTGYVYLDKLTLTQ